MADSPPRPVDDWFPGVPLPGEAVGGKYIVDSVIAIGGMGTIVAAHHGELGQRVAIKLMPKRAAKADAAVQRFLREARTAAAIESEHVVRVFDVGRLHNGVPYMVMEHLEGRTLAEIVLSDSPLAVARALDYVLQASVAIAECHARGIVHRDLKPANMMVVERPGQGAFVKVLDFGISKIDWIDARSDRRQDNLTTTTDVFGTPTHMSPEQVKSAKNVDARTDIWALGVVLYEALTGLPPFMADTLPVLSAMIVGERPRRPIERRPDLPPGLDAAVMRCLEKDPNQRPQSIAALAELLAPFAQPASLIWIERIRAIAQWSDPISAKTDRALIASMHPAKPASPWGTTRTRLMRMQSIVLGAALGALAFSVAMAGWWLSAELGKPTRVFVADTALAPTPDRTLIAAPEPSVLAEPEAPAQPPDARAPVATPSATERSGAPSPTE